MSRDDLENRGVSKNNHTRLPDFYRDTHWISWLIPLFVVANIAVFVVLMSFNNCPKHNRLRLDGKCVASFLGRFSFQPLRENPLFGPSSNSLEKLGALEWSKIVHGHQGWRLITANWLHAGLIHLVANMLSLVLIGVRLEQEFGFIRIGTIYVLSGFGGSILSSLFIQKNISVGASGALFGLLGSMLSELITNWTIYTNKVGEILGQFLLFTFTWSSTVLQAAALFTLVTMIAVNLAVGILPFVDNFAHIGGFLTGFLLGFVLLPRPQFGWLNQYKIYQYVLGLLALILLVSGLTVGLVMLFKGENGYKRCHWCHYLSCVPTSKWRCDRT